MSCLVKSNFITSCVAFRGLILTNSHQPQKQTGCYRKNLLYSHVTSLYYLTTRHHLFSICFLLQWYFSYLDYATIPYNNILDNIANGNTHKPKDFLCCYRKKKVLKCTHTQMQTFESPYQLEVQFLSMKRVPTHCKDSNI